MIINYTFYKQFKRLKKNTYSYHIIKRYLPSQTETVVETTISNKNSINTIETSNIIKENNKPIDYTTDDEENWSNQLNKIKEKFNEKQKINSETETNNSTSSSSAPSIEQLTLQKTSSQITATAIPNEQNVKGEANISSKEEFSIFSEDIPSPTPVVTKESLNYQILPEVNIAENETLLDKVSVAANSVMISASTIGDSVTKKLESIGITTTESIKATEKHKVVEKEAKAYLERFGISKTTLAIISGISIASTVMGILYYKEIPIGGFLKSILGAVGMGFKGSGGSNTLGTNSNNSLPIMENKPTIINNHMHYEMPSALLPKFPETSTKLTDSSLLKTFVENSSSLQTTIIVVGVILWIFKTKRLPK